MLDGICSVAPCQNGYACVADATDHCGYTCGCNVDPSADWKGMVGL